MAIFKLRQWASGFLLVLAFGLSPSSRAQTSDGGRVERIAFGSCCHQNKPQDIWSFVEALKPELFLFLGDNIYGDTENMGVMRAKYDKLRSVPAYRRLQTSCQVLAIWDDHDYGRNDAGMEYPMRDASQREFLRAFEVPSNRRGHTSPGIYDAYWYGEKGSRLQVILLDTRYFRSPLKRLEIPVARSLGRYGENTDPEATLLGETQWKWLEEQLKLPADLRVIASSIQVLPVDHHWERWQNFPRERERFLRLLKNGAPGPVVLLSGDRHAGEIMRMEADHPLSPGRPLVEITSSGMNQGGGGAPDEPNRFRVGTKYQPSNFGWLEIAWTAEGPHVTAQLRSDRGEVVLEAQIPPDTTGRE